MRLEPTQLIEAAAEFINFVFLMWLLKRKKFDGQVFAAFMMLYGIERYFIEFLRGDPGARRGLWRADVGDTADLDLPGDRRWTDLVAEERDVADFAVLVTWPAQPRIAKSAAIESPAVAS